LTFDFSYPPSPPYAVNPLGEYYRTPTKDIAGNYLAGSAESPQLEVFIIREITDPVIFEAR
jgi:hypothetical protein